jgi:hypothetical protein
LFLTYDDLKGKAWTRRVNGVDPEIELEALRTSLNRGATLGDPDWQQETAKRLGLKSGFRPVADPEEDEHVSSHPCQDQWDRIKSNVPFPPPE